MEERIARSSTLCIAYPRTVKAPLVRSNAPLVCSNERVRSNAPLSFVRVIWGVVIAMQFLPVHHRIPMVERIARSSALCTSCSFERTSIVCSFARSFVGMHLFRRCSDMWSSD
jgi:hypothetical protein